MAEDARIRKTKEKLFKAFVELMNESEFSDITPAKICERAGINRSTFYRNYRNTVQLRQDIENQILSSVNWSGRDFDAKTCKKEMIIHLNFLREKADTFRALSSSESGTVLLEKTGKKVLEGALDNYAKFAGKCTEAEYRHECVFYISAMIGAASRWFETGMTEPVEEVAEYIARKMEEGFLVNSR